MNPDFRDMLSALCDAEADFLVVGAYALAAHGFLGREQACDGTSQGFGGRGLVGIRRSIDYARTQSGTMFFSLQEPKR